MKRIFKMVCSSDGRRWYALDPMDNDAAVMDFPDCSNFRRLFDEPIKDEEELFVIDVHRLEKK